MRGSWWTCVGLALVALEPRCCSGAERPTTNPPPLAEVRIASEEWIDESDLPETEASGLPVYVIGYDSARGVLRIRVPLGAISGAACPGACDSDHHRARRGRPGTFAYRPGRGLVAHVAMGPAEAREWVRLRARARNGSPAALHAAVTMHFAPRLRGQGGHRSCLRLTELRILSGKRLMAGLDAVDDLDW